MYRAVANGFTTRAASGLLIVVWLTTGVSPVPPPGRATARAQSGSGERDVDERITRWLDRNVDDLIADYERIHAHPELSGEERETAAYAADALEAAGYRVVTGLGGYGVAAVMENGDGPTLLIRGDMDALPVTEETGLPYASKVIARRADGEAVGVMHACGHDVHVVNLVAVARLLAENRELWSGTLVAIAQPAEEIGAGAREMIAGGLFERVPRPDFTLALHVDGSLPAGEVGIAPRWAFANVDSVDVVLHGRGGHGARPHLTVDPIVTSASFIMALQTLVSRRIDPLAPAVVTVGAIHAGSRHNVIPDSAHMQLTVRSYSDEVREQLLEGIAQLAEDTCRQFRCPRTPQISVRKYYTPAVFNDPDLSSRARRVFEQAIGAGRVRSLEPAMVGEDFGRYARELGVPGLLYRLGSVDPVAYRASIEPGGAPLPSLHSARYRPAPRPTLSTGVRSLSALAIDLLAPTGAAPGSGGGADDG